MLKASYPDDAVHVRRVWGELPASTFRIAKRFRVYTEALLASRINTITQDMKNLWQADAERLKNFVKMSGFGQHPTSKKTQKVEFHFPCLPGLSTGVD